MFSNLLARTALYTLAIPALFGAQRLDFAVRNDFFAGFSGNQDAFERAMKASSEVIAASPDDCAEALAWHGSGLSLLAGRKFQAGDYEAGGGMWARGNAEMERAGKMAPDAIGVLIPRAAAWFAASRGMPKEQGTPLLKKAIADYEHVYELQKDIFDGLNIHNKSELLFGMADGYARLENAEKARLYFEKLAALGAGSGHLQQARSYLDSGKYTVTGVGCAGCHVGN